MSPTLLTPSQARQPFGSWLDEVEDELLARCGIDVAEADMWLSGGKLLDRLRLWHEQSLAPGAVVERLAVAILESERQAEQ